VDLDDGHQVITAVVPISPIRSHPGIEIVSSTLKSIRHWLPTAEIILTFDGVRPEQEHLRDAYEHHILSVLELADWKWRNCVPFIFDDHRHQTGMMRAVIDEIRTPLMLYVEQDCPIVTDEPIDWDDVTAPILDGSVDSVRFHHESHVLDAHRHMMLGRQGEIELTCQWSQRPHVASAAFYRRVLNCFSADSAAFIEDRMHSVCHEAYKLDGVAGWRQWRLGLYSPTKWDGNIKRSAHLDGRAGEAKHDDTQVF
jgi:hypothetical protein